MQWPDLPDGNLMSTTQASEMDNESKISEGTVSFLPFNSCSMADISTLSLLSPQNSLKLASNGSDEGIRVQCVKEEVVEESGAADDHLQLSDAVFSLFNENDDD